MALAQPLNRLGAVNLMLAGSTETGVSTLVADGINDTDVAQLTLDTETVQVFGRGWDFNTVVKTLSPDDNGNISVTANYLSLDGANCDRRRRFTVRSNLLYDLDDDTDVFDSSVDVRIIQNLEFTDAPIYIRYFIAHRAARIYQMQQNRDTEADAILAKREAESWEDLKKHDANVRDLTWSSIDINSVTQSRYYI